MKSSENENNMCKISIIIPVYNCAEYIEDCLKSALAQKSNKYELEIVVVNDGSTDNSEEKIKQYDDKELKYIKQKNGGLSSARNTGLKVSSGDFVFFLDSDDMLPKEAIIALYNRYLKTHDDIIIGKVKSFTSKGSDDYYSNKYIKEMCHITYKEYPKLLDIISVCGKLYVKKVLDGISFINNVVHEDNYFTLSLLRSGAKCSFLSFYTYMRRIREGENASITQRLGMKSFEDLIFNYQRLIDEGHVDMPINLALSRKTTRYIARYIKKIDIKKAEMIQRDFWKKLDERTNKSRLHGVWIKRWIWIIECKIYKLVKM